MRVLKLLALVATLTAAAAAAAQASGASPERPKVDFNAVLRPVAGGPEQGTGLVKFRQPEDAEVKVFLDVRLHHLAPQHGYYLERAVDPNVNDDCQGTNWARLGRPDPVVITTDEKGAARAEDLWRDLTMVLGTAFDIHFRVIDAENGATVLQSGCYQFVASR
jgi:hypothetical protein